MQLLSLSPVLLFSHLLVCGPIARVSAHMFEDPKIDLARAVTLSLDAQYVWKQIFDYDNSNNSGPIQHTYTISRSSSYSSQTFNQAVVSEAQSESSKSEVQLEADVSYDIASASVKTGFQQSKDVSNALEKTTQDQKTYTETSSFTETRSYTVGPNSRLVLYRRAFQGPGLDVEEDVLKATPLPLPADQLIEDAPLTLVIQPKSFLKNLTMSLFNSPQVNASNQVVYGDQPSQAPVDRVRDWFGGSDDINAGQGGKYVWLVPVMTTNVSEAITTIDLFIQGTADPRYPDVSMGAGGPYRYLVPVTQSNTNMFITKLTLARNSYSNGAISNLPNITFVGFPQGATSDINKDRGGDFLYLVWELQRAYVPLD
ncbi:hypothetical protein H0H92_000771 [Tricholoma furcatifolium]|nr:hypothetical protein H0H92_000771 [Tricholoma furcatifolium]